VVPVASETRLVEDLLDGGVLRLELPLGLAFFVGVDLGGLGPARRCPQLRRSLAGQILVGDGLLAVLLLVRAGLDLVLAGARFAGLLEMRLFAGAHHGVACSSRLLG